MSKTLIGMCTFGGLLFTRLSMEAVLATTTKPIDFLVVVGKPGDVETISYLEAKGIQYIVHDENYGFPYALNDIYQKAFEHGEYDNLIIIGNDVVPYPTTIDAMIELADNSDYVWISACQYDVKGLVRDFPETAEYFDLGNNYEFKETSAKPWEAFTAYDGEKIPTSPGLSDIHNLALYKKLVYDTIGFVDVNFYPAYFSDNDYARRGVNSGLIDLSCTLTNAIYFHFWSRTINQGDNIARSEHSAYFGANAQFYSLKWGGVFGAEAYKVPFDGKGFKLTPEITLDPSVNIQSRDNEKGISRFWRGRVEQNRPGGK